MASTGGKKDNKSKTCDSEQSPDIATNRTETGTYHLSIFGLNIQKQR
ncbi:hypothetical protein [uncultured Mucilaginibacter sp.]|nr:hypothetical protein [uncultured Mucilaginibacter sp.]